MNSKQSSLETQSTAALERVVGLALRLFEVPLAAVLLPDHAGSWRPVASAGSPTTLQSGFTAYPDILGDDPLIIIPDLDDDPRFGNPDRPDSAPNSHLRFFAAASFPMPAGIRGPGYLCLFDGNPRQLRLQDRRTLEGLAETAGVDMAAGGGGKETLRAAAPSSAPAPAFDIIRGGNPSVRPLDLFNLGRQSESSVPTYGMNGLMQVAEKPAETPTDNDLERLRLERLIAESSDFIGLAGLDGKIEYINAAGQRLLGLDSLEAAKRTRLIDFLMREDRSFFLGTVMPSLMRNGSWEGDSRFRNLKSGATTEVGWNLFLIKDPRTSAPTSIATVVRDITERKRSEAALRESEERFRHLVEQAGEAFLVYDLTGRIIDVNQEACDSLGYTRAELLDLSVHHIDITFDPIKGRERWKQMVPGVATTATGVHRRKDGTSFPVEARVGVFRSGGQRLLLALARDITDRKRNEEALQQARDQLEARVHERTAELALANDELRGAMDELRQSELRFTHMTANVPGMVYQLLLHEDGTAEFPYVSEGCRELLGLEPAQMRPDACTLLDTIHDEDIGEFLRTLNVSKQTGDAWNWEGRYIPPSGEIRWLQGVARPEKRDGTDTLWDGLLLDISFRKRAEQEIQDRARQAAAVAELGQRALGSGDHQGLLQATAELIQRTLGTDLSMVCELVPDGQSLTSLAYAGDLGEVTGKFVPAGTGSLGGYAILTGAPVLVEDLRTETRFKVAPVLLEAGGVSALAVAIRGRERSLGALWAAVRHTRRFTSGDVSFMQSVANVLASAMDRSRDEQALRQSEARNAAILQTALDCIVTIDHEGRIVEFNPAAEKTFGGTRSEILGKPFNLLVPGLGKMDANNLDGLMFTLNQRIELAARRLDGTLMQVELAVARISVGELPLFTAYLRDITQRKADDAALNHAKEEAESANRAKSEFLSRMSHELRTPLNAILGFGQILQMQNLPTAQNDRIGHIVSAGRHLLGLINEVLDIARIEAGRVELSLEPVGVVDTLVETLELIRPLATERNITLNAPGENHPLRGEHVMADRQRFKQVMLNLLSNAVKYNKTGGSVFIEVDAAAGERLSVRVRDTGMGVPADMLERLFIAFDRLGREHSEIQGTGLGLALSKRLIEAMGGTVGVESVAGEGTTFWAELPRAESQLGRVTRLGLAKGAPGNPEPISGHHNVLYVEDNLSNLTLIEHLLAEMPEIRLMTAMLGQLGLDLAKQHLPDLILLDLHLPDLPGWDVLAALQADPTTSQIPVIVVSADATPRQIERLMKAGARAYLTKPLEVDRFHRVLHQFLQNKAVPVQ